MEQCLPPWPAQEPRGKGQASLSSASSFLLLTPFPYCALLHSDPGKTPCVPWSTDVAACHTERCPLSPRRPDFQHCRAGLHRGPRTGNLLLPLATPCPPASAAPNSPRGLPLTQMHVGAAGHTVATPFPPNLKITPGSARFPGR